MKKINLVLGALATAAIPLVAVISCGAADKDVKFKAPQDPQTAFKTSASSTTPFDLVYQEHMDKPITEHGEYGVGALKFGNGKNEFANQTTFLFGEKIGAAIASLINTKYTSVLIPEDRKFGATSATTKESLNETPIYLKNHQFYQQQKDGTTLNLEQLTEEEVKDLMTIFYLSTQAPASNATFQVKTYDDPEVKAGTDKVLDRIKRLTDRERTIFNTALYDVSFNIK